MTEFLSLGAPEGPSSGTALVALIYAGFGLVGVLATLIVPRLHSQKKEIRAVREQVQNSHKTNLRDDIDRVIELVENVVEGQKAHTEQIADLRTDVAWERRERTDLARRLEKAGI